MTYQHDAFHTTTFWRWLCKNISPKLLRKYFNQVEEEWNVGVEAAESSQFAGIRDAWTKISLASETASANDSTWVNTSTAEKQSPRRCRLLRLPARPRRPFPVTRRSGRARAWSASDWRTWISIFAPPCSASSSATVSRAIWRKRSCPKNDKIDRSVSKEKNHRWQIDSSLENMQ